MAKILEAGTKPMVETTEKALDGADAMIAELQEALRATAEAPIDLVDSAATETRNQLRRLASEYMDVLKAGVKALSDLSPV